MKKIAAVAAVALAVPSLALAGKPANPGNSQKGGKAAPKVMYVLRGTLTAFTAANGSTNGSVSIMVKAANHHGATLAGQTLTFPLSSSTKVAAENGTTVTVNDNGMVKVRGPKKLGPTDTLATVLQALTAFEVVDQGTSN